MGLGHGAPALGLIKQVVERTQHEDRLERLVRQAVEPTSVALPNVKQDILSFSMLTSEPHKFRR